jgi:hypothetical protein
MDENSYIALLNTSFDWTTHHPLPLMCGLLTSSVAHIPHLEFTTLVMMKPMCFEDKAKMHQFSSIRSKCIYLILTIHSPINKHARLLVFHTNPRQLSWKLCALVFSPSTTQPLWCSWSHFSLQIKLVSKSWHFLLTIWFHYLFIWIV